MIPRAAIACILLICGLGEIYGAPISELEQKLNSLAGESSTGCAVCQETVHVIEDLFGTEVVEQCLTELVTYICKKLPIDALNPVLCNGIISEFADIYIYVISQLVVNPNEVCGLLLDDCGSPINPLKSSWTMSLPGNKPPYKAPQLPESNAPKLRVLQLADLHFDREYKIGSEAACDTFQCCRPANDTNEKNGAVNQPAGHWGTVGNCDSPYWMVDNMLEHIAKTHTDLDYVVISGDYEPHDPWNYKKTSHEATIRNMTALIKQYLPDLPLYFAVGNHEGVPINTAGTHSDPKKFWMDWLYGTMADAWKEWIPDKQDDIMRYRGCYTTQLFPSPGLRLITLNTEFGDAGNVFLFINETDPDGTMTWLMHQLAVAEAVGDKVHVLAHIPGGDGEALEGWALNYNRLINRFENTVAAQFFAHVHADLFAVMYENVSDYRSRPTGVMYISPSVTTYSAYNPAYRIYTIDGNYPHSSFQVLDTENWFLNLTEANADVEHPVWKKLYSAKEAYGMPSLFAADWNNLIERFKTDDQLLAKYISHKFRRSGMKECDDICKKVELCTMRQAHHDEYNLCRDLGEFSNINKFNKDRKLNKFSKPKRPQKKEELLVAMNELYTNLRSVKTDPAVKCPF